MWNLPRALLQRVREARSSHAERWPPAERENRQDEVGSEPRDPIEARIERGRPLCDRIGDHAPRHGAERQAEMAWPKA